MADINIEEIVIGFLAANKPTGWEVYGDMPKERPEAFILVDRTGGPREFVVQDRAEILIEVYHRDSRETASDQANVIADIVKNLEVLEPVMRAKVTSLVKLDDLLGQYWRYQIYCDVYYRRDVSGSDIVYPVIPSGGAVNSVNGKQGDVILNAADIPFDNSGTGLTAEQVQAALAELAARPSGEPDEPWNYIDLTDKIMGAVPVAGMPDPIVGATGALYWSRVGRSIDMVFTIIIPASATWSAPDPFFPINTVCILDADLPAPAKIYDPVGFNPFSVPGKFSLISTTSDDNTYQIGNAIGSVVTDFGGSLSTPVLTFFNATEPTTANLSNLLYDGNFINMVGNNNIIYGSMRYEAEAAA